MASIVIVLAGIKSASEIIIPFLLALFLAIILSPAYGYFRNKGFADSISLVFVISFFILFLTLIANLLGSSIEDFSSNIDFYEMKLIGYFKEFESFAMNFGFELPVHELLSLINSKEIMLFTTSILKGMGSIFTDGFIVLFVLIFMLLESSHFIEKVSYAESFNGSIEHIKEISTKIKEYMVLKALISLLTGFIIWVSLLLVGTDYPFLWAVLAFLLNFVPNIGSIIAAVPAVLLTLVQLGGISALIVSLIYGYK
jgi:AI-2 transport protein TqsA